MKWFYNVLSWHFACLAVALFVLGSTAFTAQVMANSPPPTTSSVSQDPPPPPQPQPVPVNCGSCSDTGFPSDDCPYICSNSVAGCPICCGPGISCDYND